jgi:hypothetical protein
MSAERAAVGSPGFSPSTRADPWLRDRRFFTAMAVAAIVTVFAGFAPSYYLKTVLGGAGVFGRPVLSPLLHVHGLVFTAWLVVFLVQTRLVAGRRIAAHRKLGYASLTLAAAMIAVGFSAAVDAARRGSSPPGGPPPLVFMIIPMADLAIFATLVGAAVWFRNRGDIHKRLMLMATISILTPAIARLPGVLTFGPLAFFALTDVFAVVCLVYDRVARGHVHPAFWWGAGLLLASQVGRLALSGTSAWLALATWLTR